MYEEYIIISDSFSTEKISLKSRLDVLIYKQEYYNLFRDI